MKKIFYTLLALPLFVGGAFAQNQPLPDGGFRLWEQGEAYDGTSYWELADEFWNSLNLLSTLPPDMFTGPITMFKETGRSGQDGDFCPKMESNQLPYADDQIIFLPGVVGSFDVITEKLTAHFGRPFTSRPKSIKGWMKYKPVNGDSASIFCEVYRWNETLGRRVIIGRVEQFFYDAIEDWTEFNLPLTYNNDQTPDTISVLFVSSAGYNFDDLFHCEGQIGSTMWVDDVAFVYDGDESANEKASVLAASTLNPNPSVNGIFKVTVPEACRVDVVSLSGNVLMSRELKAGPNMLDLSSASKGIYMVRLSNSRGVAVLKAVRP